MSDPSNIESSARHQHVESEQNQPPLPFNPLTTATHDGAAVSSSSVGNSVVRDLMRVYERLTQSSTPQTSSVRDTGSQHQHHQQQHSAGFQSQHQQHSQFVHHQQRQDNPHAPPGAPTIAPTTAYSVQSPPVPYHHVATAPSQPREPPYNYAQAQQNPYYPDTYAHQPRAAPGPPAFVVGMPDHQQHGGYALPPHEQQQGSAESRTQDEEDGEDNEEDDQHQDQSSGRARRKRRGSSFDSGSPPASGVNSRSGKSRKKGKSSDGRWSKRFTWPEDLHRDFVSAIFDVGLKHSSPSTIMEHMPKHEQITTERIKSHLQKYRLHRAKSKKEFLSSYESSLSNFQASGLSGVKSISGGEVAAHLSYSVEASTPASAAVLGKGTSDQTHKGHGNELKFETTSFGANIGEDGASDSLMLPQLTEAEKQSPIGAAMGYLMGLFFSLKQQLMIQRAAEKAGGEDQSKSPVQAVFNSFVTGGAPMGATAPGQQEYTHDGTLLQASIDSNQAGKTSSSPSTILPAGPSATRTNLEESNMMKREMQNQMALQNKMRALKQQELNKYKDVDTMQPGHELNETAPSSMALSPTPEKAEDESPMAGESSVSRSQGAGETAAADAAPGSRHRGRGLSMGGSDEFWNTDVVDDNLFEFLMNN